jgi:hypothetical protein
MVYVITEFITSYSWQTYLAELASISVHIVTSGVGFFQPVTSLRIFATEQSQNNQDEQ